MSLTILDVEQGTEAWHDARRGLMTASVMGQYITAKTVKVAANDKTRAMTYQLVAERITGITEDRYVSYDMERGHFIEPIVRDLYTGYYEPVEEAGFMVLENAAYRLGYSPDGTVGTHGLIEIKSQLPKLHLATILAGTVPPEFMAQCQTGLFVSGREWLDFISFCGGWPLYVKRIYPDAEWHNAIHEAATQFEQSALQMIAAYALAVIGMPMTERVEALEEMRI